jgi:hypothetical protein
MPIRIAIVMLTAACTLAAPTPVIAPTPTTAAPAAAPQRSTLTPEQIEAIKAILPPGAKVDIEVTQQDGGSVRTREEGTGKGAGAEAVGDKLSEKFTGSAPEVGKGADGSQTAKGGTAASQAQAENFKPPANTWANPLLWIGVILLGGAGFCIWQQLTRPAFILGGAGIASIAAAFFPGLLLFAAAGVVLVIAAPYLISELEKTSLGKRNQQHLEATRALVGAIYHPTVPAVARTAVLEAVAKEGDASDKAVIEAVKKADGIDNHA